MLGLMEIGLKTGPLLIRSEDRDINNYEIASKENIHIIVIH